MSQRPFTAEATPLSASSKQHMWELLAGNCTSFPHNMRGEGKSRVTMNGVPGNY